jgi:hypothetical protein
VANRGIIELAGADNVMIDGDDPATTGTRNLTIQSVTSTTAGIACIRLSSNSITGANGANNNTVKNCIIIGSRSSATSTTTNYGIQFSDGVSTSSSSTGAYSSVNTIIQNNAISRAYYGINAIGNSTTYPNTGLQILDNVIGSATSANNIGLRGIVISYTSATAGSTSVVISGNDVRAGDYSTTGFSASVAGIEIGAANPGCTVRRNNIHDVYNQTASGYGAFGITISSGTTNTGISIENNFIRDMVASRYSTGLPSTFVNYGIFINAAATGININHNTIALLTVNTTGTVVTIQVLV